MQGRRRAILVSQMDGCKNIDSVLEHRTQFSAKVKQYFHSAENLTKETRGWNKIEEIKISVNTIGEVKCKVKFK